MTITAADLVREFKNCKSTGQGKWQVTCPAHEDGTASLSVAQGREGRILLHCHAGCSTEAIVASIGRSMSDLMPEREEKPKTKRKFVAAYDYRDAAGQLLYQSVRWEPKTFSQRKPDGNGGWAWKLNGVQRVLYRLSELNQANLDELVAIVEGEKDVDCAKKMGIVATSNVGGAGKWLSEYCESLRGRHVVIVPDNDQPGRDHAKSIYQQLQGVAASVKILELPSLPAKGDFSDWANAGGTKEKFLAMAANCTLPSWALDASALPPNHEKQPTLAAKPQATSAKKRVSPTTSLYQQFPVEVFPGSIRDFIKGASSAINIDPVFVALPTLAVLAGAIGSTRQVLLKRGYSEPAVVWGAIIAESGSKKSPALDAPCKPVIREELRAIEEYQRKRAIYESEMTTYKADLAAWQRGGRKSGEPAPDEPEAPICRRTIVNDITIEALAAKLGDNPRGLMSKHDELSGFFSSMNQYRSGGKGADEAKYLSMFGARELFVDRKGGTLVIPRAAVSIIGSVQPGILKKLLTREHFESGMSARFLLAYPPPRVSLWTEDEVSEELALAFGDAIQKLQRLDFHLEDDGSLSPVFCPLTSDAKARWIEFYNQNAQEVATLAGDLSAAWSKLCGYAARFALILRFARWAQSDEWEQPQCVDLQAIEAGIALSHWFANEARRVYSIFTETDEDRELRQLVELIHRHGGAITARDLAKASRRFADSEEAEVALQGIADAGIGTWQIMSSSSIGGRPTRRLSLGPIVGETQAIPEPQASFAAKPQPETTITAGCDHNFPADSLNVSGNEVHCPGCGAFVGFVDVDYPELCPQA